MKQKLLSALVLLLLTTSVIAQLAQDSEPAPLQVDSFATKIKKQSNPQIVDTRTADEFAINHINGAINIDMKAADYAKGLTKLDKTKPVFVYSIQNYRSGILAKQLRESGYGEVYELKSGIPSWIGAGYPYYTSAKEDITYADYKKIITDNKIVLVDIGTKYCGACLKVKKLVDTLQSQNDNSYKIVQVELYNNPQLAAKLKDIKSVPTVILYKDGKIVWEKNGFTFTKEELEAEIAKAKG
jgi:rhodanese-related sulfurtransferase/glutaredoxin-related protein